MTQTTDKKIAVVTGANRGLGLEIARQLARDHGFHVVLAARDATKVAAAAVALRADGLDAVGHVLDITSADSAAAFAEWISDTYGAIDVLVNNAGVLLERIYGETENIETDALDVDVDLVGTILDTNLLGPLRVTQKLVPLIKRGGRIVNMSSQMGQFGWADSGMVGYRLSKTALNGLTANLAVGLKTRGISVNCCCPGWVKTDMGSKFAMIDVEEGAQTPVWLAAQADAALTGKFFHEKTEIPW
ncbi:MAG: SDR family oxidoreductase [Proteobacteria bacterium]|nr:SDR family oxidoreductase [Pseudomonadota bacterium]MDA1057784.1 SDR family oxidoreductase [Pseudomonadota bacterium]